MAKIEILNQQKPNIPPTVNAGADVSINLPATGVSLVATAVDTDGYIVSVQWSQIAGPSQSVIENPISLSTPITGLQLGQYTYQIIVYDNMGASATDTVIVMVNTYNILPFKWVASGTDCVKADGKNTGQVRYSTLKRVSDDVNEYPLDVNSQRTIETGLPQESKPNIAGTTGYVPDYQDLVACPILRRFHSIVGTKNVERNIASTNYTYSGNFGLDNTVILENTLPGATTTELNGNQIQVLKTPTAGEYTFKVRGTGSFTVATNDGSGWQCLIDIFMRINGVNYPLAPVQPPPEGYSVNYNYIVGSPAGSASHKENTVNFNLSLDQVLTLPINAIVEWIVAPRFFTTPSFRNGTFRINNLSMELDIKL